MACPVLASYCANPFVIAAELQRQGVISKNAINFIITAVQGIRNYTTRREQIGKQLYLLAGSARASRRDFNGMTFLQLEHEARVKGLLGSSELHQLSEWKLRLKLEIEARKMRVAVGLPAENDNDAAGITNENEDPSGTTNEYEEDKKVIYIRNNGIIMRY
jgi:hypothetical protein